MNTEEKQLLLVDLCARLPYGVTFDRLGHPKKILAICPNAVFPIQCDNGEYVASTYTLEDGKPYLRPMSSMTEEEKEEMKEVIEIELTALEGPEGFSVATAASSAFEIDFYNKHHLDYRGLIEKGLALEAPEGMYKQ